MWRVATVVLVGCGFDVQPGAGDGPGGSELDAPTGPLAGAPIAYWSFDTDAVDRQGNHDGRMVASAELSVGARGRRGEALVIPSDGSRVDVANPGALDFNRDFTWHVYVRTSATSGALFSRSPDGTAWNQGSKAVFVRGGTLQWDTGWVGNPRTDRRIDDDQWHQVIVRYLAQTDRLDVFVDPTVGAVDGSYGGNHNVNQFDEHVHVHNNGRADSAFSIGGAGITSGFADVRTLIGMLDEAAVFDRALVGADLDRLITDGPAAWFP